MQNAFDRIAFCAHLEEEHTKGSEENFAKGRRRQSRNNNVYENQKDRQKPIIEKASFCVFSSSSSRTRRDQRQRFARDVICRIRVRRFHDARPRRRRERDVDREKLRLTDAEKDIIIFFFWSVVVVV